METNLENWVVSSTITGMEWNMLLDPTQLEDDPADPGGVCRKAMKGFPGALGFACAEFRRGGFGGAKPENPAILEPLIDVEDAIRNAQECDGGSPDWQAVVDGTDDSGTALPRCLYTFSVLVIADRLTDGVCRGHMSTWLASRGDHVSVKTHKWCQNPEGVQDTRASEVK